MNHQTATYTTQGNIRKSSFVIFLLALFVFTSCPVKLTFFSFVSNSQTLQQQQQKVKPVSTAQQFVNYASSTCKSTATKIEENVQSVFKTPQFKATAVLISIFALTFAFFVALNKAVCNFPDFRESRLLSPLYVRNCLFLI